MPQAVIFDLDGTLTQSEEGIYNGVRYALNKMGRPEPDPETLRRFIGPPLVDSFRMYCGMGDTDAWEAVRLYRVYYHPIGVLENSVYPGIRRLLRMLHRRGDYIAVATGKPLAMAEKVVKHFGLDRFIAKIESTKDGEPSDKDPLIRRVLPEEYSQAWMVGDRLYDVIGGKRVGIKTIGVGYGYGTEEELRGAGCDYYAKTVQDVIDILCPDEKPLPGAFLSMEGMDGSGKTTQLRLLTEGLTRYGFEVLLSREPGGCPVAEKIRQLVLSREYMEITDECEALLYAASRAQHVREVIRPAVEEGKVLLCDRFVDSSAAYQGGGRQIGVENILAMNHLAVDGTLPMATVYLDIDRQEAMRRRVAAGEPDRIEVQGEAFQSRVEAGYKQVIAADPARFLVVDASKKPEEIAHDVLRRVLERLMENEAENE